MVGGAWRRCVLEQGSKCDGSFAAQGYLYVHSNEVLWHGKLTGTQTIMHYPLYVYISYYYCRGTVMERLLCSVIVHVKSIPQAAALTDTNLGAQDQTAVQQGLFVAS